MTDLSASPTAPTGRGTRVELRDLARFYGDTRALDGLSLTLEPGELVALLGPSGCGKTTVLRALAGFESLDRGDVFVDGDEISRVPAQRRDMGMVFQSYSLFPNMDALHNVAYGLRIRKVSREERANRAAQALAMVGLADRAEQYPHQMSGGQQQRVALARALVFEPRVLLLDEPLSALDAKVRLELRVQIRALQQRLGITTLFVTHDQEEALSMADRVCVMRDGRIEQVATPDELYNRPATPFVAEFVGTMNRLPAVIVDGVVEVLGCRVAVRNLGDRENGSAVDVMIRPEELEVRPETGAPGVVMTKTFFGSTTRLGVRLDAERIVLIDQSSETAGRIELGAQVSVGVVRDRVMVGDRTAPGGSAAAGEPAGGLMPPVTASSED